MNQNIQESERNNGQNVTSSALPTFLLQLPRKLQKYRLKFDFKKPSKADDKEVSATTGNDRELSAFSDAHLEKQLQVWKENPIWLDQSPDIKVGVPAGSLCNLNVNFNVGLPPDAVFNILTNPGNKRVFKNIKEVKSRKVLIDEGSRQRVEVEQAALWRFLWWSGTITVHLLVDQNREDHSVKFKQLRTGFMNRFEGCWRVEPLLVDEKVCHPFKPKTLEDYISCSEGRGRIGSKVSLEQLIQPSIVPPPPISWYLRGVTAKTTEMLITDLAAEAARIRGVARTETSEPEPGLDKSDGKFIQSDVDRVHDIKERWASRRKARQRRKRLP